MRKVTYLVVILGVLATLLSGCGTMATLADIAVNGANVTVKPIADQDKPVDVVVDTKVKGE